MTTARKNLIDPASTPYYHCMARCVRRAFLCGKDQFSGKNYEHRRQWVVDKLQELVSVFAIEVCAYAVMSNHYHVVLHINTQEARQWNRDEILNRWTALFSGSVLVQRYLSGSPMHSATLAKLDEHVEEYRSRLMDISWFIPTGHKCVVLMSIWQGKLIRRTAARDVFIKTIPGFYPSGQLKLFKFFPEKFVGGPLQKPGIAG